MSTHQKHRPALACLGTLALALTCVSTAQAASQTTTTSAKPAAAASTTAAPLTGAQASIQAKTTGKAVPVTSAETETSTLTANPSGSYTLTSSPVAVRKKVGDAWESLDATLRKNADGTISPALSSAPLILSGGGATPLAVMRAGNDSLSLTLPVGLPSPTLSGNTATYANVLSGVDLVVAVTPQGGYSDVFVIHNATAAANPKLSSLLTASMAATGVTVATDPAGNIQADNAQGQQVFTADAPAIWDSSTATATGSTTGTGAAPNAATASGAGTSAQAPAASAGTNATSTTAAPGVHAHSGSLAASVHGNTLTLTPDKSVLTGPGVTYPVYADPTWSNTISGKANWASPSENHATSSYWGNTPDSGGNMAVGQSSSGAWGDTLLNFSLPSELGADGTSVDISGATLYVDNWWSNNCTKQAVDVYAPSALLSSGFATWNDWFTSSRSLGGAIGSASLDASENTGSCQAASAGIGLSTSWITNDMNSGKTTQTLALAGTSYSAEEFDGNGSGQNEYHLFSFTSQSPELSVTFTHTPATPTDLTTSPNESVIGTGSITLNAPVSDPDGGTLGVKFYAYVTGSPTELIVNGASVPTGSNTTASYLIAESTLNTDVVSPTFGGSSTSTELAVTWYVTVSVTAPNGTLTATSGTESFTYETAILGAPTVDTSSGAQCTGSTGYTVGTSASFTITPAQGTPGSYAYQLNGAPPATATANAGDATITIVPTAQADVLTVNAIGAGGNIGQPQTCTFYASTAANETDGDLTGDGSPDLLLTGTGTSTLPPGLWLSSGTTGGTVTTMAENIGTAGTDLQTVSDATNYTGTQAISGLFQGAGYNSVLDYNPAAPIGPGSSAVCTGEVLELDGQTLPIAPQSDGQNAEPNAFAYYQANGGNSYTPICATSLGEAGPLANTENGANNAVTSGVPAGFPDLLEVVDGSLYLVPNGGEPANWQGIGSSDNSQPDDAYQLLCTNPAAAAGTACPTSGTASAGWSGWTIATTLVGNLPAVFAANNTTGALYYYSPADMAELAYDTINSDTQYTVTPVELATSGYTVGGSTGLVHLQAADENGTVDLWTVTPAGVVSTVQLNTAGTALTALSGSTALVVTSHDWGLDDMPVNGANTAVSTAADASASTGSLPLTGHGSADWNIGDQFSPDLKFNNVAGTYANTGSAAVTPNQDYTISLWVNPAADGGVIVSQSAAEDSTFVLYPSGTQWEYGINTNNGNSAAFNGTIAGSFTMNTWSHLVLAYTAANKTLTLFDNGAAAGSVSTTTPPSATGDFVLGAEQVAGAITAPFAGQIADVQVWNSAMIPPPSPTHQWLLGEGTGSTINDSLGGLGGYVSEAGATWATSGGTTALSFDGDSGYAETNGNAVNTASSYTVSAWVNLSSVPSGNATAVSEFGTNNSPFYLQCNSGSWAFVISNNDTTSPSLDGPGGPFNVQANTWYLVTGVYNATTDTAQIYVNGLLVGTMSSLPSWNATGDLDIGRDLYTGLQVDYFPGEIRDVETWNSALSAGQVAAIY